MSHLTLTPGRSRVGNGVTSRGVPKIVGLSWDCPSRVTVDTGESDLWPITWSDDDLQYTCWGDGNGFAGGSLVSYGIAKLTGDAPNETREDVHYGPAGTGNGKLSSIISVGGVLYFWVNLQDGSGDSALWKSTDKGVNLVDTGLVMPFAEAPGIKPSGWIQHGQDNALSPDGYVYYAGFRQDGGAEQYILRVPEGSIETQAAYEAFASADPYRPSWSTDLSERQITWNDPYADAPDGFETIHYIAATDQYVMIVAATDVDYDDFNVYVADHPWGPWVLIGRFRDWCATGGEATGPLGKHIAPRWIGTPAGGTLDFWITFSGAGATPADDYNIVKGTFTLE